MKTLLSTALFSVLATTAALAQPAPPTPPSSSDCVDPCQVHASPAQGPGGAPTAVPAMAQPTMMQPLSPQPAAAGAPSLDTDDDTGWHRPAGQRFTSGFRLGWMYLFNYDVKNRVGDNGQMTSLKDQYGLKSPNMFVIGYEGFYRIVGHSWLNVLMVGNVSVAGLDQSKFIPTGSGLLGFEIERQLELGVGVNLTPDTVAPSHMIIAAGWTPKVGSIQTPIHFFYIPDSSGVADPNDPTGKRQLPGNSRIGATLGMNW
jgi:hypothetical protein